MGTKYILHTFFLFLFFCGSGFSPSKIAYGILPDHLVLLYLILFSDRVVLHEHHTYSLVRPSWVGGGGDPLCFRFWALTYASFYIGFFISNR